MYFVIISRIFLFAPSGIFDFKNGSVIPADISSCSKTQKLSTLDRTVLLKMKGCVNIFQSANTKKFQVRCVKKMG